MSERSRREALRIIGFTAVTGAGCTRLEPGRERTTDWRFFNRGPMGRRYISARGPSPDTVPEWRWSVTKTVTPPVVYEGHLLTKAGTPRKTVSFDARTGQHQWSASPPDSILSSPAVSDGTVYTTSGTELRALALESGSQNWSMQPVRRRPEGVSGYSPVVDKARVYAIFDTINEPAGRLFAGDRADGSRSWVVDLPTIRPGTVAVANSIVVAKSINSLVGLDAQTGETLWRSPAPKTDSHLVTSPSISGGHAYAATADGVVFALALDTGTLRWRVDFDAEIGQSAGAPSLAVGPLQVFVATISGDIHALKRDTGESQWRARVGETQILAQPALAKETVYIATTDFLAAFDRVSGERRWRRKTKRPVGAPVVITDKMLYLTAQGIHALA